MLLLEKFKFKFKCKIKFEKAFFDLEIVNGDGRIITTVSVNGLAEAGSISKPPYTDRLG
jgi:hypothetical protein